MVRAAIVGLGRWGQRLVDSVQEKSERIRFVAGTTRTLDKARSFANSRGIALFDDYAALLADPRIDAVVLASPHSLHAGQAIEAARAGKHVFVEKPFTLDRQSAIDAALACAHAHCVLAVGFNRRFRPAFRELMRLVESGALGTLLHVEAQWSGPIPSNRAPDSWRYDPDESPAGGVTPKGIHLIDAMMAIGGLATSVYARSERRINAHTDDVTSMLFRFASGATGYMGTLLGTPDYWRLQAIGSRAWAEIAPEHTLTVCRLGEPPHAHSFEPTDIERAELEAFADAVSGPHRYPVSMEQAVCGSAVIEAITASIRSDAPVAIEPWHTPAEA